MIAAFETNLALYDPVSGAQQWLRRAPTCAPPVRCNDGRCDRDGRFWFGTMAEPEGKPTLGKLFRLDRDGSLAIAAESLGIVNALSVSPDGNLLYFADTPRRTIFVCNLDRADGMLSNQRLFAETPAGAFPDGANIDAEGHLWNAHWNAGQIVRYAPDGRVVEHIDMPVRWPTCLAFGGTKMNLLFVTTACDDLSKGAIIRSPQAGNLFIYETDATGLPDADYIYQGTR